MKKKKKDFFGNTNLSNSIVKRFEFSLVEEI